MQEKRNIERFDLEIFTRVKPFGAESDFLEREYTTSNISSSGMYFYTEDFLPVNTNLSIELYLPVQSNKKNIDANITLVKIDGCVNRIDKKGMAVSFDEDYKIFQMQDSCFK